MKIKKNPQSTLEKRLKKVLKTPPSFAFFVAIHDFVECIEQESVLSKGLSHRLEINRDLKLPNKYASLQKVHQGIRDFFGKSSGDLGHERYMTIGELRRIHQNETSENNAYWKKRETYRKLTAEVYERLSISLSS